MMDGMRGLWLRIEVVCLWFGMRVVHEDEWMMVIYAIVLV
jgi:hypothetical protein